MRASLGDPFLSVFPLPALLSMEAAGLEISEHSIKYLLLSGKRRVYIKAFGNKDLPTGAVAHGEIQDMAALAEALRSLRSEIGTSRVHVSLPEQKGYVFRMALPRAGDLALREAIEFRLEEYVPLSASDIVFDWEAMPWESTDAELVVNVTAFPRSTIDAYYEVLTSAGYLPLSFEIESQAAARAVLPKKNDEAHMIVDFGETRTAISIADCGVVRFTTSLELAGGALTQALVDTLKVSFEEAERLKNEEGISGGATPATRAMLGTAAALRSELNRHFVYWHTHGEASGVPHKPIASIVLCGGNANLAGLSGYLGQAMRVPIMLADVWQHAFDLSVYVPPIPRNQSLRYATVAGLALRRGIQSA